MFKHKRLNLLTAALLGILPIALPNTVLAQAGDKKEKKKDLLKSTNWRKWVEGTVPMLTPEETAKGFKIAPGFKVELVASHPMIKDPVFAEFDMQGRLWVCEFQTYMRDSLGTDTLKPMSRVQVLEDTDKDGKMDKATTFLKDVVNPRSLSIVEGGALVALGDGNLVFAEDTNKDLVADKTTVVAKYAVAAPSNIEHAENGLHFAIDNWLYSSKSKRKLKWRNGKIEETATKFRGQWGFSSDAYGRLYYNSNSVWFMNDSEPYHNTYKAIKAPGNSVYSIRTNTALNRNYKPGTIKEDGRVNRITAVSGLAVHSDGGLGEEWQGTIFACDPGTNTLAAFKPNHEMPKTSGFIQQHYPDKKWTKREFLASSDERFRPVNASFGPDGALYIVDLNRGIIQDKRFLTSYLRAQSEERGLDKHIGKGRIWRIVPEDYNPKPNPKSLVEGLDHPYLWWRLASQKRITEQRRTDLVSEIQKLAMKGSAKGRAHALWTLAELGELSPEIISSNLQQEDWFSKLTALRLVNNNNGGPIAKEHMAAIESMAASDHPVLSAYASSVLKSGGKAMGPKLFKDKMPSWVEKDAKLKKSYQAGLDAYDKSCVACHQPNGAGLEGMAPTLVKSDWVIGPKEIIIGVALHGVTGPIKINGKPVKNVPPIMPGQGSLLNDQQISDILTYVRNAWGNKASAISADEVKDFRAKHKGRAPWTQAEVDELRKK